MPIAPRPDRQIIFADQMLTADGWRRNIHLEVNIEGVIEVIGDGRPSDAYCVDALLPALGNVHSHSFQRAMAGLAEGRSAVETDDFWGWRETMYRFLEHLTPDDVESIAAQVQLETLEAGFAAIGEFHYLHHQSDGSTYDDPIEMTQRLMQSAEDTGIGYTHLPVLYMRGGLDDRPLNAGQLRFGSTIEEFETLYDSIRTEMDRRPADFVLGAAAHSLRAVSQDGLATVAALADDAPLHIHIAEQIAEVEAVKAHLGAGPIDWLLDHADVDDHWCLVHATHGAQTELRRAADAGAVVGLCPITEANLGDGLFDAKEFFAAGGQIGIGSDSNVRIDLAEELRLLEYGQRLSKRQRAVLCTGEQSSGRYLYEQAAHGGAQALGRNAGRIEVGALADLTALDVAKPTLCGMNGDQLLDAWVFAGDNRLVSDVWAAGRHVVANGAHRNHEAIAVRFGETVKNLRSRV